MRESGRRERMSSGTFIILMLRILEGEDWSSGGVLSTVVTTRVRTHECSSFCYKMFTRYTFVACWKGDELKTSALFEYEYAWN